MDAVVAFIANGEATKPVELGERALDDPAEHAKPAAVGRAATAEDRNNAAGGEAITMWLRIVATVALEDVGPSARPPAASANGGQVRDQGVEVGDVPGTFGWKRSLHLWLLRSSCNVSSCIAEANWTSSPERKRKRRPARSAAGTRFIQVSMSERLAALPLDEPSG